MKKICFAIALLSGGCATLTPQPYFESVETYPVARAKPCPLCGELPTIRKCEVALEKHPSMLPPVDELPPFFLFAIGCGNTACLVTSSLHFGFWHEEDAVAEWNKRVEMQKPRD